MTTERRTEVSLPRDIGEQLMAISVPLGHQASTLFYSWFRDAVRLVEDGHGDVLPRKPKRQDGQQEKPARFFFKQGKDEFDRWSAKLEAAGSSLRAVARVAAAAYIEADGYQELMSWPPFRVREAAAA